MKTDIRIFSYPNYSTENAYFWIHIFGEKYSPCLVRWPDHTEDGGQEDEAVEEAEDANHEEDLGEQSSITES